MSKCLGCGKSYRWCLPRIVPTTPGRGVTGWCEDCETRLNLGTKKSIIAAIIDSWGGKYEDAKQAALDYLDRER